MTFIFIKLNSYSGLGLICLLSGIKTASSNSSVKFTVSPARSSSESLDLQHSIRKKEQSQHSQFDWILIDDADDEPKRMKVYNLVKVVMKRSEASLTPAEGFRRRRLQHIGVLQYRDAHITVKTREIQTHETR